MLFKIEYHVLPEVEPGQLTVCGGESKHYIVEADSEAEALSKLYSKESRARIGSIEKTGE